jgi:luciferase family oxidoreductase group 1
VLAVGLFVSDSTLNTQAGTTQAEAAGRGGVPSIADQIRGAASGRAEVPLSILDLAPIGDGYTPGEALATTTELARRAEAWGYHRFWVAEHHGMPGIASSSPAVLIAHLAAATRTIRLGSGGVMLPNHAPLVIAEQFGLLHALHPGRIDLGLGRAPGTDQATASALNRPDSADAFPLHVAELAGFLDDSFPPGHRYAKIRAVPGRSSAPESGRPPIWLLGSSGFSAQLAGALGLPFAFAHHFSAANTVPALELYHDSFRPSEVLDKPYALIGVGAIAADTAERARWLAGSAALSMLRLRRGAPGLVPTPEEAEAYDYSAFEQDFVDSWIGNVVLGDGEQVRAGLASLRERTGADELMITGLVHGREARLRSFELIAEAHGLSAAED